jgi:hypothetical protein
MRRARRGVRSRLSHPGVTCRRRWMSQYQHAIPVTLELPELLMLLWGFDGSIHIVARAISASVCIVVLYHSEDFISRGKGKYGSITTPISSWSPTTASKCESSQGAKDLQERILLNCTTLVAKRHRSHSIFHDDNSLEIQCIPSNVCRVPLRCGMPYQSMHLLALIHHIRRPIRRTLQALGLKQRRISTIH